ncbi:MAG: hypothetical protein JSV62_02655 [Promethearchaeota archaeon]|nr:MAG: hypothetical protein JSV62_02655 [Candidatus Lokiarchaeota archaeon]
MKRKDKFICLSLVIIYVIIVVGIILSPVIYYAVSKPIIYYIIEYDINLSNREEIIDKVENLNYTAYLNHIYKYPDPYPETQKYIDRDLINLLKSRIENDTGFYSWPPYSHYLRYYFLGENHSKLYLTYSNNTIFSLKDQNNQSLLLVVDHVWGGIEWYLNFTQIPYVYNDNSTLVLSESIFIDINMVYVYPFRYYSFDQYLVLNKNLDVILIFIYHIISID